MQVEITLRVEITNLEQEKSPMGSNSEENAISYGRNHPLDPEEFRRQAHMVVDFIADYYSDIENLPVLSPVAPGYLRHLLPTAAPNQPECIEAILGDVRSHIFPGITHWMSPNYYAYFPSSGSTAGFLGEMLSVGLNVVGFNWVSSPAATELESIVMDWLGKMLHLPEPFLFSGGGGGVLQGTTCEAILATLTAARDKALRKIGRSQMRKLVVYASDQTHCSVQKAAKIAGIDPENFRVISTDRSTAFAMSAESLRRAVAADVAAGLVPLYLCATVGTTSSAAVDPLAELCGVATEQGIWVHVDAAYAGGACVCPEFRNFINGVEEADSFSFNAHKWFLTNLDCCCLWVKQPENLVEALSTSPEYLKNKATDSKKVVDYKDWQIVLSRRFRSLKLWMVLRSHGVANLRNFIRGHVDMAKLFQSFVAADERFEVVVPRHFAVVCFRIRPVQAAAGEETELEKVNLMNQKLMESMNAGGKIYLTHAVIGGLYIIRFAVGATLTEERHVRTAWVVVQEHAAAVLASR